MIGISFSYDSTRPCLLRLYV